MDEGGDQGYVRLKERSLEVTPSWAVAVVVFVILAISIALEYILHLLGHWLHHKHKKALSEALEKIKAELMILGFISLLLTVGQGPISDICIPSRVARTWHPCNRKTSDDDYYDPCLKKYIMNESEADVHPINTQITEEVDAEDLSIATYESEKINCVDANVESDKDEVNGENILGKVFDTTDDAYAFYNDYAFVHGFGIRIHTTCKNKGTNEPYRKTLVCDKEGFKREDGNTSSGHEKKRRREVRIGCKAMLRISKRKDGKWFVDLFDDTHNHELSITPTKVMKHRSHAKFHRTMECKSLMVQLNQSGLKPSQIKKTINAMKTSNEPDVTSKQCVDVLSEQRKHNRGREFYGLIKHLQDKALVDNDQYYVVDLCSDGCPRNIFWADGRSRDDFTKFGDVVVFDVTYMTNKFKMPFAPFTGVNHHGQSILFGGALLENEKEETFVWLFEHFLKCMFSKYPNAIITDQDKAMGNAIKKVFPNARHRFCAWHIKKHELEHLRPYISRYSDFQESYKEWVMSDTIEEFETMWEVIRDKYKLENNCWITDMYNQRIHWAKAFLKDIFLAGMTTSGRSESINSFFDDFVNSSTMLNDFLVQYDKAVASRRAAEEDEDFKTMNSRPVLSSIHPIEAKAGECYTRKVFEIFKKEWIEATNNLTHETLSKSTEEIKYRVGQLNVDKKYWRIVSFCLLKKMHVTCSCAKYETCGILCKHILYVMKKRHVDTLPSHYILPRWTLNARYKVGKRSIGLEEMNNKNGVSAYTLWCVRSNFNKVIEQAKDSPSEIENVNNILIKLLQEQEIRKKPIPVENVSQGSCVRISQFDMTPQISVRDPVGPTNTKGRPKIASRIKSSVEGPKKRTCSYCQELGHYATSCSKRKGKVQMVSNYGIHQLHIFIFVLAVVHVLYCLLTLILGRLKMKKWRAWEEETKTVEYQYHHDPERFRFARETTFGRRHLRVWSNSTVLLWIGCFFRQFLRSVPKVDYLTLRHGFINTHLPAESQQRFDFQKYISRSLEEDFKVVVGISPTVWFFAVLLLLTNTHDWYAYLWLPFIPLVMILLIGTKLQVIITKMGRRTHEMADVVKGTPMVQPGDDLFWFGRPKLVLLLINFVLFQNAFQLAFFLWSWYTFGFRSCFHHRVEDIVIRISMAVVIQFLCSYVTLPLYALVTQMGSRMKPTIFSEDVAKALKTWHHTAKKNIKHGHSPSNSPFSSRPGTPLHGSTSPMHLLHRYPDNSLDSLSNSPKGSHFEHEGWANESPQRHDQRYEDAENIRKDEIRDIEEGEIQESTSSTQLPIGPRPVRGQHEVDISDFSFGREK